jgi:membrane-associated phospholipid phosphatase
MAMKRRIWPLALGLAYIFLIYVLGGLKTQHVVMGSLALLDYYNERTRHFLKYFLPFILTGLLYDSMRYYYWWGIEGRVHVEDPYQLEKALFGIMSGGKLVTPNEFFETHTSVILDFFCGLAYITFVLEYLGAGFLLFLSNRLQLLRVFGWTFLLTNAMGFATYYIYPAAPPWYITQYGLGPAQMHIPPSTAAAARFDQIFGTHFFDAMYGQGIDVYGAFPSLHVSYPFLVAWAALSVRKFRVPAVAFYFLMCFSAVYLQHHYILDVILGTLYAAFALLVVRALEARKFEWRSVLVPAASCLLLLAPPSSSADEKKADDAIFPLATVAAGFKPVPAGEALNAVSLDVEAGGFEARPIMVGESELKNLYLAFAVDWRYLRECSASKQTALCTFFHSSVRLSGNLTWSDVHDTSRYEIILVPVEYVTGTFGKQGPDLRASPNSFFATLGTRAEYLRDLGLGVEHRILGALSAGVNYSSASLPLGPELGFRWIGSVRVFAGGSSTDLAFAETSGAFAGGIETQVGLALDLERGSVAFTNTSRLEGDLGFANGVRFASNSEKLELKYLHSVCRSGAGGGCNAPRPLAFGGGVRYEYVSASGEAQSMMGERFGYDHSVHRLILFAELARF